MWTKHLTLGVAINKAHTGKPFEQEIHEVAEWRESWITFLKTSNKCKLHYSSCQAGTDNTCLYTQGKHQWNSDRYRHSKVVTPRTAVTTKATASDKLCFHETWTRWLKSVNGKFAVLTTFIYFMLFGYFERKRPVLNQLDYPQPQLEIPLLLKRWGWIKLPVVRWLPSNLDEL